jgi:hypothetical protein
MPRLTRELLQKELEALPEEIVAAVAVSAALRTIPALSTGSEDWSAFWYWPEGEHASHALLLFRAYCHATFAACVDSALSKNAIEAISSIDSKLRTILREDLRWVLSQAALRASNRAEAVQEEYGSDTNNRGVVRVGRRARVDIIDAALRALSAAINTVPGVRSSRSEATATQILTAMLALTRAIAASGEVRTAIEEDLRIANSSDLSLRELMWLPLWSGEVPARIAENLVRLVPPLRFLAQSPLLAERSVGKWHTWAVRCDGSFVVLTNAAVTSHISPIDKLL